MVVYLHARNQLNSWKCIGKKVQKTVQYLKFTKSTVRNFVKNQWSITKPKIDLELIAFDLQAKNQLNICMH